MNYQHKETEKRDGDNLLSFKLKYMQNTSNSHLKKYSSITTTKLHYVS